jgi:DNA repair protein RadC
METTATKTRRRLRSVPAIDPQEVADNAVIAQALDIVERRLKKIGVPLHSPADTASFCVLKLANLEHEVFTAIYLDNRHRVIETEELFRGTIDGATVHPREVVKAALRHNAAAVIFAHNHPSQVAEPSMADEMITTRLRDALALVDIRVLDHLVVAGRETVSLASRGLL